MRRPTNEVPFDERHFCTKAGSVGCARGTAWPPANNHESFRYTSHLSSLFFLDPPLRFCWRPLPPGVSSWDWALLLR